MTLPYTGEPLPCSASIPHTTAQTAQQIPICRTTKRYRAAQGKNDYTNLAHDLAVGPAAKFQFVVFRRKTKRILAKGTGLRPRSFCDYGKKMAIGK